MFHILDESLFQDLSKTDIIHTLEKISHSYLDGNHIFFMDPLYITSIVSSPDLSKNTKAILQKLSNESTYTYSLLKHFNAYVRIVADSNRYVFENNGEITISNTEYNSSNYNLPSVLLCENLTDCELYEMICNWYTKEVLKLKIPLSMEDDHGGGHPTWQVFNKYQTDNNRIVLCISDKDTEYPGATSLGGTAKAVNDCYIKLPNIVFYPIDCRELENLIPLDILEKCVTKDINKIPTIEWIKNIQSNTQHSIFKLHIDIKNSIKLRKIIAKDINDPHRVIWLQFINSLKPPNYSSCTCLSSLSCPQRNIEQCTCILYTGLGSSTLGDSINLMRSESYLLSPIEKKIWSDIGTRMINYFCASIPKSAI